MRYSDCHPSRSLLAGPAHDLGLNKYMYVFVCLFVGEGGRMDGGGGGGGGGEGGTVGEKKGERGGVDEKE